MDYFIWYIYLENFQIQNWICPAVYKAYPDVVPKRKKKKKLKSKPLGFIRIFFSLVELEEISVNSSTTEL